MNKKGLKKRNSPKSSQIDEGKKLRKKARISGKEEEKKGMQNSLRKQVKRKLNMVDICDVCGDSGFINALMYCSVCPDIAVHQYCLGIPPGSIDDTFDWICEYCSSSRESGHHNSSVEESGRKLASALEMETDQYGKAVVLVIDELEPLCILPPLPHQGSPEHQTQDADAVPNTASTHGNCLLNSREQHEPADFSFIHRSMNCDNSHFQNTEGISEFDSTSLDHQSNDKEESEAPVSSFMESPKEIMSGLVLLVTPSGDIIIQRDMSSCACLALPTVNMSNNCIEMNSVKQVNKSSPFQMKPQLPSKLDEPVENSRKVAYVFVDQETAGIASDNLGTNKEIDAGQLNEETGFSHAKVSEDADDEEGTIMNHPGSLHQIKRKRIFDLIPSPGPECKRLRSKRSRLVPSLNKEVGACEVMFSGVQSLGKEKSHQNMNAFEVDMPRKTHYGTCQTDPTNNPLMRNKLHNDLINKNCGLFSGVVDTCGNNVKERAAQVDEILYDQGLDAQNNSHACQVSSVPRRQLSEYGILTPCLGTRRGITRIEASTSTALASSPRIVQDHSYLRQLQGAKTCMKRSPLCKGWDEEEFEQTLDIKKHKLDENAIESIEASYLTDLTSPMLNLGSSKLLKEHAVMEKQRDETEEFINSGMKYKESITYPDAWKLYDAELLKLKINLNNEREKFEEVVKKNRRRMWKVVYELENTKKELETTKMELETTKKELQGKMVEFAKKEAEVEMAKELAIKKDNAFIPNKKEAYDIWLDGYSSAESVINHLQPELNWDGIKAVGNLMFLCYR